MDQTPKLAGHTRIRTRALTRLAKFVGSQALNVPPGEVDTQLRDSGTNLGVTLTAGIRDTDLELCATRTDATLFTFADEAAKAFADKMSGISGYAIGEVDIHFTHIVETKDEPRRVR